MNEDKFLELYENAIRGDDTRVVPVEYLLYVINKVGGIGAITYTPIKHKSWVVMDRCLSCDELLKGLDRTKLYCIEFETDKDRAKAGYTYANNYFFPTRDGNLLECNHAIPYISNGSISISECLEELIPEYLKHGMYYDEIFKLLSL